MPRGLGLSILPDDVYWRRYVIGKFTPRIPARLRIRQLRAEAVSRGYCIECRAREREGDLTHCRHCLDTKRKGTR